MKNWTQKVWKVGPLSTPKNIYSRAINLEQWSFFFPQMIKGFNFQKFYNHFSVQQKAATVIQYLYTVIVFLLLL